MKQYSKIMTFWTPYMFYNKQIKQNQLIYAYELNHDIVLLQNKQFKAAH